MFTQQDVDQNPDQFIRKVLQGNLDRLKSYTVLANWILTGPGIDLADLRSNIQYDFHYLFGADPTDQEVDSLIEDLRTQLGHPADKRDTAGATDPKEQSVKDMLQEIKGKKSRRSTVQEMLEAIRNDSRRTTQ